MNRRRRSAGHQRPESCSCPRSGRDCHGPVGALRQGPALEGRQLRVARARQVEQGAELVAVEGGVLGGSLDLDEAPVTGLDDVHVGLGAHVLLVGKIEAGDAVDDADADGAQRVGEHGPPGAGLDEAALGAPGDGVGQGDVGPGDRCGAGAAVGLKDVAIQRDGVLAQGADVDDAPQRPADEAGDLVGAPADLAAHGLAAAALGARAGEHRVLGGHPALPAALAPARDALGERRRAQHAGAPEADEDAALGVVEPAAGDGDGAQLIGRAPVLAGEAGRSHWDRVLVSRNAVLRVPNAFAASMGRATGYRVVHAGQVLVRVATRR